MGQFCNGSKSITDYECLLNYHIWLVKKRGLLEIIYFSPNEHARSEHFQTGATWPRQNKVYGGNAMGKGTVKFCLELETDSRPSPNNISRVQNIIACCRWTLVVLSMAFKNDWGNKKVWCGNLLVGTCVY